MFAAINSFLTRALTNLTDVYWPFVSMLLHGDSPQQFNQDTSTNVFPITANGAVQASTRTPFTGGPSSYGSGYFTGTASYLTVPDNAVFNLAANDFTIECWIRFSSISNSPGVAGQSNSANSILSFSLNIQSDGRLITYLQNAAGSYLNGYTSAGSITINTWYHIAFVRDGNTLRQYVNGVQDGTVNATGFTVRDSSDLVAVGAQGLYISGNLPTGYISNFRLVNGTCLYPSGTTFTPPTVQLTAVTNTALLTLQTNVPQNNNQFFDTSTNNFTVTRNGNTTQGSFNPFVKTYPYSVATNGGSGYFDGTGDYLTVADNAAFTLGTNDFTIECWVYFTSSSTFPIFIGQASSGLTYATSAFFIQLNATNDLTCQFNSTTGVITLNITSAANAVPNNSWNHIVLTRNGNTLRMYINGVQAGTTSAIGFICNDSSALFGVGCAGSHVGTPMTGYISNFRLVNGTCLYPSGTTFTPPTAPLTAVTNTALLLGMSNGAIYDNTMLNNLETVASAQISTSVFKYGTGSIALNGTTDYLNTSPANQNSFAFGSGDFTIEMWVYATSVSGSRVIYDSYPTSTGGFYPSIQMALSGQIFYNTNTDTKISGGTLSTNTWYHIAVCRSGTSTKLFINGTQSGSTYTDSNVYLNSSLRPYIGASGYTGAGFFPGYIDDIRVTKGIARYTTTFTPPTAAFPNQGDTPGPYVVLNQTSIFGYGFSGSYTSITNLVSNTGVVATDTTGVGTVRYSLAAAGYGTGTAMFGFGSNAGTFYSMTNLVSTTGVVATDTATARQVRMGLAAATYGTDKAIFGYGGRNYPTTAVYTITNLVSNTGAVAIDAAGVGTARLYLTATGYGTTGQAMFGYGSDVAGTTTYSLTNLVSNTGVVASDTTGVGTARQGLAATRYGTTGQAIFGYGANSSFVYQSVTNLVSNTGVIATDTTGVGTARASLAASVYGSDKAIFGYGDNGSNLSMTNLVSNTGVVASNTTGVGTARYGLAAAGYGA